MTNFVQMMLRSQKCVLALFLLLLGSVDVWATHNRAGEITYCDLGFNQYEVQIITHTKTTSPADRQFLIISWGDNTSDTLWRIAGSPTFLPNDAQENIYAGLHTYIGPGIYILNFVDPNRNAGVLNIPNSVQEPFCVESQLIIAPTTAGNCSVRFLNPPLQDACVEQPWYHNSVAFDPDGDSLSYELIPCKGLDCNSIAGYLFPDQVPANPNTFNIDPFSGTISWLNPQLAGEYNLAFRVTEWRNGQAVGWVVRDMQVTVVSCPNNQIAQIDDLQDTCITANTLFTLSIGASDPNAGNNLTMNAQGEPFTVANSATFIAPSPGNPVNGNFAWTPSCAEVRTQPYQLVVEVTDDASFPDIPLTNVSTMNITVVAPAVQNPTAAPNVSAIDLNWDANICSNAVGYKIYRRIDATGFVPGYCETGVPSSTGYVQIDTTQGWANSSYTDIGPLAYGQNYCYMIVACFADGAQSYASEEFCTSLNREAPVITNVTVDDTDISNGEITVRWENALELDTVQYQGPYQFMLYRSPVAQNNFSLVFTSSQHPYLIHPDTSFVDQGFDTESQGYTYRVELLHGAGLISTSSEASSIFLTPTPGDEKIVLSWSDDVPWVNTTWDIYREVSAGNWILIGSSIVNSYLDSGLVNGSSYCYYVESSGGYSDPNITSPLTNLSQEACAVPIDLTPPCAPDLSLLNECEIPLNSLTWNNPNNSCSVDNAGYNIYYSPFLDSALQWIASITRPSDTTFTHVNGSSVAGCYAVTAIDSSGNESAFSDTVCGVNCPLYDLPNVFTPNGDGVNDTFRPLNPYRGVFEVNLQIYNRWGQLIFETKDPAIGWNGDHKDSGGQVPDGVYFYSCDVYFLSLNGTELINLKGQVQILDNLGNPNN